MARFKLKDLAIGKLEYGSGAAACEYNGNTRYVRITDIDNDGSLGSDIVSPSYIDEKYILNDGDVLFARTGATVGKTYRYKPSDGRCLYAGFLIRVIPNPKIIRTDYLYFFTKSPRYKEFIQRSMKVVAQPNINAKQYGDLEFEVPSLKIQDEIVNRLSKVDSIINNRQSEIEKMDNLIKARFVEMFGTIHDNKYGFEIRTIQDVCEKIKDGTHQTPVYTDDSIKGFKFLSSKDVTTGKIDWTHIKYIPKSLHDELYSRIAPRKSDLLLAKNGTTGIAAIVDTDDVFDIYVSLALLRPVSINSTYLWGAVNSKETKEQFDTSLKGVGVPNLHLGEIKKTKIIVPPLEEQEVFSTFVAQVDKSKVTVQKALNEAQLLFDSLMQQYFG